MGQTSTNPLGNSNHSPRISVLMAVHNGEQFLAEAVESILNQTYRDFEFIVIDDGSTDDTKSILARYANSDPRVRVVHQQNHGLTKSLNKGLKLAVGEYIARMDGDDVARQDRFEKQLDFFRQYPDLVLLGSEVELITEKGCVLGTRGQRLKDCDIRRLLFMGDGGAMTHPVVMFPRLAAKQVGGYDEAFSTTQDLDLFIKLSERGRIMNHPETLLKWRQHGASVNRTKSDTWAAMKRMAISGAIERLGVEEYLKAVFPSGQSFHFPCDPLQLSRFAYAKGAHASADRLLKEALAVPELRQAAREDLIERRILKVWWRIRNLMRRFSETPIPRGSNRS